MWWGYLHGSGHVQAKRWFGDPKDYTEDCKNNPFVLFVVEPFEAATREKAFEIIQKKCEEHTTKQ